MPRKNGNDETMRVTVQGFMTQAPKIDGWTPSFVIGRGSSDGYEKTIIYRPETTS